MPGPLHWFRNPRKLPDEELVERLAALLTQLGNTRWQEDDSARAFLEGSTLVHLREVENRIAQGRLF